MAGQLARRREASQGVLRLASGTCTYTDAVTAARHDSDKKIEFDVFISHAFEDKEGFVRALAQALEARHLRPWYDEFTLRPGDSLRRSIDHGLLTSQAGVVVLSKAFFAKHWTAYELDGLVQLNAGSPDQVAGSGQGSRLIPVWHGVDAQTVTQYSPSLANLVALNSGDGVEAIADRIFSALRPTGSTLLFAHAKLTELGEPHGWHPPVVTDDWWLDVAEASATNPVEGTFQSAMGWGRWGFPLPGQSTNPRERGHRLARAAAQMMWQREAETRCISQCTSPEEILDFIDEFPGLSDACIEHPSFLLSYAPQLAIPGVADWLQQTIDDTYDWARSLVAKQGISPDCPEGRRKLIGNTGYLALRDVELVRANRSGAACDWIQGDINGPPVRVYDIIDYAGWLVSDSSLWMGSEMRAELLTGIGEWGVWPGWREDPDERQIERLYELLDGDLSDQLIIDGIRELLARRMELTAQMLGLNEDANELAERLAPILTEWWPHRIGRGKD
jgi:TIR domain